MASHFHVRKKGWEREVQLNTVEGCVPSVYLYLAYSADKRQIL